MQGRDEDNLIAVLENIVELSLELPVGVVDQNKDARATVVSAIDVQASTGPSNDLPCGEDIGNDWLDTSVEPNAHYHKVQGPDHSILTHPRRQ